MQTNNRVGMQWRLGAARQSAFAARIIAINPKVHGGHGGDALSDQ